MKRRPTTDRPTRDVDVEERGFSKSSVPEIEALRLEMEFKQLLAEGNRLENLIFHSAVHNQDAATARKKLLDVHTRICELESRLGFERISRLREEMRRPPG